MMQYSYAIEVMPVHEREAVIEQACSTTIRRESFPFFQNKTLSLPVVRISIGLPIYRMANYRTQVAQKTRIRRLNLKNDFFTTGQENQSAQEVQHNILIDFAKESRGESIRAIYDVLEEDPRQTETLLISNTGVVVNGNRRLAAMRELYAVGGARYASFSHVECMVLPPTATLREIKEVEVRLQMQPRTLLPYEWVNEALAIQDLMNNGQNTSQIMQLLGKKSESEIRQSMWALEEAELYLAEWVGAPEDYERVKNAEQIFKDMGKAFSNNKKTGEELEASRRIAWLLVDHSTEVGQRVYNYNFAFGEKSDEVLPRLASELNVDLTQQTPSPVEENGDGEADLDIEIDINDSNVDGGISYRPLVNRLRDPDCRDDAFEILKEVCDSVANQVRGQKAGRSALKHVQKAHTELTEVDLSQADPGTLTGIQNQLSSISQHAQRLECQLAKMLGVQ